MNVYKDMCKYFLLVLLGLTLEAFPQDALAVYVSNSATRPVKSRLAQAISVEEASRFYEHCLDVLTEDLQLLQTQFAIYICPANEEDLEWARLRWPGAMFLPQAAGDHLGSKIQNTFARLIQAGFERVLLIGSDAPTLPPENVTQCYDLLANSDVVLGPAKDGGFYLIGARKELPSIDPIRWSTEYALVDTKTVLTNAGLRVEEGPIWYDVNVVEDLWDSEGDLRDAEGARAKLASWWIALPKVSIIIPVLNEVGNVDALVPCLQQLHPTPEIVFVDGGSQDATADKIRELGLEPVMLGRANRGAQLNAGIAKARGHYLLFLHADTRIDQSAYDAMIEALRDRSLIGGAFSYGLQGSQEDWRKRCIEKGVMLRNRLFDCAYGDQGYFIKKASLGQVGLFKELPLMEDVEWFERLTALNQFTILKESVETSGRRIFSRGWVWSCILNGSLVLLYKMGVDPAFLAKLYYGTSAKEE